jgi:hypothetical protein
LQDAKCQYNSKAVGTKVARIVNITQGDEMALMVGV